MLSGEKPDWMYRKQDGGWGKAGVGQTHLPERALLSKHGYQHAGWDHEAGQQAHQDAQQLCPGWEAVAVIL